MKMVQVTFSQPIPPPSPRGRTIQTVWVDLSWNLTEGDQVTFRDENKQGRWMVDKVYETIVTLAELDKKWGLDLPRSYRTER